jgi:hypothetical protein
VSKLPGEPRAETGALSIVDLHGMRFKQPFPGAETFDLF